MKVHYAEQAVTDLVKLRDFVARNNPTAASRIAKELVARIENLSVFPRIGIEVPQAPATGAIRDMVFGNYVIRYALQTQSIVVLRVWHHLEDRLGS